MNAQPSVADVRDTEPRVTQGPSPSRGGAARAERGATPSVTGKVPIATYVVTTLVCLVLAAHFLRAGSPALLFVALGAPWALLSRRRWVLRAVQFLLAAGAVEWVLTAQQFVEARAAHGQPYTRLAIILSAVTLVTALASWMLGRRRVAARFDLHLDTARISTGVFIVTFVLLAFVHVKVALPMLIVERFFPGWGWLELVLLAVYGAWLGEKMLDRRGQSLWRGRLWTLFTVVFFGQLLLGLAGIELFLQTGELHMPVPALIVGGPMYRGEGFFMVVLFLSTVVLVGPAWCSHLCYIGAWDHNAAVRQRRPGVMPVWGRWGRWVTLTVVFGVALGLRLAGLSGPIAIGLAAAFGLTGVGVMLLWSRKAGVMAHCTTWCPMGLVATRFGKLNPFRIRITPDCTSCMACTRACRFDALSKADVARRKPAMSCTLCGDCLGRCKSDAIRYEFLWLKGPAARALFLVLVLSLHASFVGLARI